MLSNFFFTSILISSLIFSAYSYNGHLLCLHHQKSLLLQLRNELIFNSSLSTKLVRWNEKHDCCKWYGVECDDAGYVVSLQLDGESISGGIGDSSSLFRLECLEKLNLAYNDFKYTQIPKGIHSLNYLTHLNLSSAGFGGQVPLQLSFLTRLVSLDISNSKYYSGGDIAKHLKLEYPNLEMLVRNMTGLRKLYLSGFNITSTRERRKWSHIISSYLPNITSLSLVSCDLYGPLAKSFWQLPFLSTLRLGRNNLSAVAPNLFSNLSSLTTLSLFNCSLKGSFPNMILQIPTLQNLDLSKNFLLSGSLPPFPHNSSLKSISLGQTNFSGSIPHSISNLKTLSVLDMFGCKFTGLIPPTFANLTKLTHVDLSQNLFTGSLSSELFEGLSSLVYLNLLDNSFSGNIPRSLFALPSVSLLFLGSNNFTGIEAFSTNVSKIGYLYLSDNQMEGPIPDSLFQLQSLEHLQLSGNLFSGTFQLEKIRSFPNLTLLHLYDNNLRVDVNNLNSTPFRLPMLTEFKLARCNLNEFPDFIKHSDDMATLDLSNNGIGGEIPAWIWGLNELSFLLLDNNSLSGSIPTSLCINAPNLRYLDLSVNKLSGTIPSCLLAMTGLNALNLGRNNFSSHIPDNFSPDCGLTYFDVNNNTLQGKFPRSLKNCKRLEMMNFGNNNINDTFPCMLSSRLRVLVLRSNNFHGEVGCYNSWPDLQILDISSNHFNGNLERMNLSSLRGMVQGNDSELRRKNSSYYSSGYYTLISGLRLIMKGQQVELPKIWSDMSSIDLSSNNFQGEIPNAIGDLTALRLLNFSHNALNGSISNSFGKLRNLEALDLSRNQLTGKVPLALAGLTFLSFLNLSYNNLVGQIPTGSQLQLFTADSFKGNPGLCGFNLNINCIRSTDENDSSHEKDEGEKREIEWEYVSAALGYVVGLGSLVWLLVFCRSFRKKYFDKIDDVVQEMFDARDMRRRRRASARRRAVRNQRVRRN